MNTKEEIYSLTLVSVFSGILATHLSAYIIVTTDYVLPIIIFSVTMIQGLLMVMLTINRNAKALKDISEAYREENLT